MTREEMVTHVEEILRQANLTCVMFLKLVEETPIHTQAEYWPDDLLESIGTFQLGLMDILSNADPKWQARLADMKSDYDYTTFLPTASEQ